MVYKLEFPYKNNPNEIDVTMLFNLNEWYYEEAISYNGNKNTVVYDLDYGEHLLLRLQCNKEQCSFDVKNLGVYENKQGQIYSVIDGEYNVSFARSVIADIAVTEWAPAVLRNFMAYLRPFNIPDYWYTPGDICNVVEKIKEFFNKYLGGHE